MKWQVRKNVGAASTHCAIEPGFSRLQQSHIVFMESPTEHKCPQSHIAKMLGQKLYRRNHVFSINNELLIKPEPDGTSSMLLRRCNPYEIHNPIHTIFL